MLEQLSNACVTLNGKCEFSLSTIKYLGHVISADGINAYADKTNASQNLPPLADVSGVHRFLGMANQVSNFIPDFVDKTILVNEPETFAYFLKGLKTLNDNLIQLINLISKFVDIPRTRF